MCFLGLLLLRQLYTTVLVQYYSSTVSHPNKTEFWRKLLQVLTRLTIPWSNYTLNDIATQEEPKDGGV